MHMILKLLMIYENEYQIVNKLQCTLYQCTFIAFLIARNRAMTNTFVIAKFNLARYLF